MRGFPLVLAFFFAACAPDTDAPPTETPADHLAMSAIEASGGWSAWAQLPTLRFDWMVVRDSVEVVRVRHLWDKTRNRARVEWEIGTDSTAVALLDLTRSTPEAPVGEVYVDGEASAPEDSLLSQAYGRFINDSYWLLAPLKTFDPGVNRGIAADSARDGSDVLTLSFGDVGITPGDRYWLRIDPNGLLQTWTYQLEGDTTRTMWTWSEPIQIEGPAGPVTFLSRKSKPDGTSIVTLPSSQVPSDAWTSTTPLF